MSDKAKAEKDLKKQTSAKKIKFSNRSDSGEESAFNINNCVGMGRKLFQNGKRKKIG